MDEQLTTRPAEGPSPPGGLRGLLSSRSARLGILIGVAVLIGVILWLVVGRDSSSSSSSSDLTGSVAATPIRPVALSASGLATLAKTVGQPIYWAGPKQGYLYELQRNADGNVYIRYLPQGVDAGAKGAKYLTVATYPFRSALKALQNVNEGRHVSIPGGGVVLVSPTYKKSVHLAYPNVDYQVEVYDPNADQALALATSGRIQPAG